MSVTKSYLTPQEIAEDLGIKTSTARAYIRGQMEHIRIGNGRILVEDVEYERWKVNRTRTPNNQYVQIRKDLYDEIMKAREK